MSVERRLHDRVGILCPVIFRWGDLDGRVHKAEAVTRDLSEGGVGLTVSPHIYQVAEEAVSIRRGYAEVEVTEVFGRGWVRGDMVVHDGTDTIAIKFRKLDERRLERLRHALAKRGLD